MSRRRDLKRIIGANIHARLKRLGLNAYTLADAAGVSSSYVYEIIAGTKSTTVDWLERVARSSRLSPGS